MLETGVNTTVSLQNNSSVCLPDKERLYYNTPASGWFNLAVMHWKSTPGRSAFHYYVPGLMDKPVSKTTLCYDGGDWGYPFSLINTKLILNYKTYWRSHVRLNIVCSRPLGGSGVQSQVMWQCSGIRSAKRSTLSLVKYRSTDGGYNSSIIQPSCWTVSH